MTLDMVLEAEISQLATKETPDCQNPSPTQFLDYLALDPTKEPKHVINVIGSPVTALPFDAQIEMILSWASSHESKVVCVANVHMLPVVSASKPMAFHPE